MKDQIKIIITDDKDGFRKIIRENLVDYNIKTVAEAENGIMLLKQLASHSPDVILLDLEMPRMNGNITMHYLSTLYPDKSVVILSLYNDYELMLDYEDRGAKGFITKDEVMGDFEQFAKIIEKVRAGGKYFNKNPGTTKLNLTEIQKDIIFLNGSGMVRSQIAEQLGVTADGIGKQEKKIREKMGVKGFIHYCSYIAKSGLEFLRPPNS